MPDVLPRCLHWAALGLLLFALPCAAWRMNLSPIICRIRDRDRLARMKLSAFLPGLFLLVLQIILPSGTALASDGAMVGRPEVKVGDWWSYRRMNVHQDRRLFDHVIEVTFVGPEVIVGTGRNIGRGTELDATWTRDWNPVVDIDNRSYEPVPQFFAFPLIPGQSRRTEFQWSLKGRVGEVRTTFRMEVTVKGWEEITVPAGTFRAIKVEASGTFQRQDAYFAGRAWWEYWYVPEVRNWVKRRYRDLANIGGSWSDADELLSYGVK